MTNIGTNFFYAELERIIIITLKKLLKSFEFKLLLIVIHLIYHISGFQPDSSVLEWAIRVADEISIRTIKCPVLAQMISQRLF
jgi:hypothetical protein